jgi:hypothetical protein
MKKKCTAGYSNGDVGVCVFTWHSTSSAGAPVQAGSTDTAVQQAAALTATMYMTVPDYTAHR